MDFIVQSHGYKMRGAPLTDTESSFSTPQWWKYGVTGLEWYFEHFVVRHIPNASTLKALPFIGFQTACITSLARIPLRP